MIKVSEHLCKLSTKVFEGFSVNVSDRVGVQAMRIAALILMF